jgi:hypothetical protein
MKRKEATSHLRSEDPSSIRCPRYVHLPVPGENFRRWGRFFLLIVAFFCGTFPGYGQQRPLVTEDVETVPSGSIRTEMGFDFEQSRNFPLSGLQGDLSRFAVVSVTAGLGSRVEVETGGVLLNHLRIDRQYRPSAIPLTVSGSSTRDIGDFFFATKVRLVEEGKRRPAMGMRMGAELPNSNQARGIGLNRMSTFGTMLLGKTIGRWRLTGNLGMAIMQAPIDRFSQNDPLLYSAAVAYRWSKRLTLAGEWQGRASLRQQTPIGTESEGVVRLGARIRAAGLMWDISTLRGYHPASPRTGISFGVTYEGPFALLFQ